MVTYLSETTLFCSSLISPILFLFSNKRLPSAGWALRSGRCQVSLGEWKATLLCPHRLHPSRHFVRGPHEKALGFWERLSDTIQHGTAPSGFRQPPPQGWPLLASTRTPVPSPTLPVARGLWAHLSSFSPFSALFSLSSDWPANPSATAHESLMHHLGHLPHSPLPGACLGFYS